jgi:hypothetical protein
MDRIMIVIHLRGLFVDIFVNSLTNVSSRPDRLKDISDRFNLDQNAVLDNVLYARAYTSNAFIIVINNDVMKYTFVSISIKNIFSFMVDKLLKGFNCFQTDYDTLLEHFMLMTSTLNIQ